MRDALTHLLSVRRGHFQMESGYHSDAWHDLAGLFKSPTRLQPFVRQLALRLAEHRIDAVCGPQVGGAKLAGVIAAELGILSFRTERREQPDAAGFFPVCYTIPREQRAALRGLRVAIVDDAISAGSAVRGTYHDLVTCEAQPVVIGALFIFGQMAAAFAADHNLAVEGLAELDFNLWKPDGCPLCQTGKPVEKISDRDPGRG